MALHRVKREQETLWHRNRRCAQANWGKLTPEAILRLRLLTSRYSVCVASGEIKFLDNRWYITHAGLLGIAERRGCAGILAGAVYRFCDRATNRWVFKATVYKTSRSKGFVGYGDADPSNTSPLVRGAEMRVAETRAVNRALRKAYGIGLCSRRRAGIILRFILVSTASGEKRKETSGFKRIGPTASPAS